MLALLSLLSSSAVGSILGGIFGIFNKRSEIEVRKLDLDHERAKWAHDLVVKDKDLEYAKAEAQGRKDVAFTEGEASIETARMVSIAKVQEADRLDAVTLKAAGKWAWVLIAGEAIRAIIRPLLTIILSASAIYLNWLLIGHLTAGWDTLEAAQRFEMGTVAFQWITGQASAVLGYWFVSRGAAK